MMMRENHQVDVDNGQDAVDYVLCNTYDFACIRLMMPELSGIEV